MTRTFLCALLLATISAAAADAPGLKGSAWVLSGMTGQTLVAGTTATLHFDGQRAWGTDGCNRYTAPSHSRVRTHSESSPGSCSSRRTEPSSRRSRPSRGRSPAPRGA